MEKTTHDNNTIESPSAQLANNPNNNNIDTSAGDLGSIVTLVGKSSSSSSKRVIQKQNETATGLNSIGGGGSEDAQKKTMESSEKLAAKHTQHNATSAGETNAANVNQVAGPSNSIIVSSVIVVLVAAFVVVGMAVVAVVAVVARHCNLSRHLQNGS